MRHYIKALALFAPLALCGCYGLTSNTPPPVTYAIHAAPTQDLPPPAHNIIMTVMEPRMPVGLESDRIALYTDNGRRLDHFTGAQWPDHLSDMLEDVTVKSMRSTGALVDTAELGVPPGYVLSVDVLDFAPVYGADTQSTPRIDMALRFTLIRAPNENIVDEFTLSASQSASQNSLGAIVTDMEKTAQNLMAQAVERIKPQLKPEPASKPGDTEKAHTPPGKSSLKDAWDD